MKEKSGSDLQGKISCISIWLVILIFFNAICIDGLFAQQTIFAYQPMLAKQSSHPPNILIIPIDGIGTYLGCYGDKVVKTPNIDKLASQGIRYTNAYTVAGVCAPSRSSYITGMYAASIGAQHMRTGYQYADTKGLPVPYETVPPPYVKGFTEFLRAHNYYVTNDNPIDWQFTSFSEVPFTLFDESGTGDSWRNRPDKNQPFCSIIGLWNAHEHTNWDTTHHTDASKVTVPPYFPDVPEIRSEIARAYDRIEVVDSLVGTILEKLKEDGLEKNTIVILWSDHGEGFARGKRWLYNSGIHVPLIIRWPGHIKAGSVSKQMVSMVDVAPTILSMTGIGIPVWMQGKAILGPQAEPPRKYIFAERDRMDNANDMVRAIHDEQYEYIENWYSNEAYVGWIPYRNNGPIMKTLLKYFAEGKLTGAQKQWFFPTRYPRELYDVTKDPYEIHNLAYDATFTQVVKRMRTALREWQHEIGDMGSIPESQMVERMWPGHKQPVTANVQLIPNCSSNRGETPKDEGGTFAGPMTLQLYCPTQGASIGYTFEKGEKPHWNLYTGPLKMAPGISTIRAKAIRYGYKESGITDATFNVSEQ
jgi:arylsulfatase A-like enzyme